MHIARLKIAGQPQRAWSVLLSDGNSHRGSDAAIRAGTPSGVAYFPGDDLQRDQCFAGRVTSPLQCLPAGSPVVAFWDDKDLIRGALASRTSSNAQ